MEPADTITQEKATYYLLPSPGLLQIAGADRLSFVQRQTTNDIRQLSAGTLQVSVLTNPAARILDVFHLLVEDETLLALTLPGQAAVTTTYLKSRIFFMDKVTLADLSTGFSQLELIGPGSSAILQRMGIPEIPGEHQVLQAQVGGDRVRLLGRFPGVDLGLRLLLPVGSMESVLAALGQAGCAPLSRTQYELLRIETGLPAAGSELTEEYTPLETGLAGAISASKGCYTGQEIIARQITYDKVTQQLCGVRLGADLLAGVRLWAEGKPVGTLTSTAISPRFGPIGLAIVKRAHIQPGTELEAGESAADLSTHAVISALPFA